LRSQTKAVQGIFWLGGLDSNQDSQSQSLESYPLDDLPAGRNKKESRHIRVSRQPRFILSNLVGIHGGVNRTASDAYRRRLITFIPGRQNDVLWCDWFHSATIDDVLDVAPDHVIGCEARGPY
jgi:hypothetical protein